MTSMDIYLTFNGNCKAAFDFYRDVFGGDFSHVGYFRDMPGDYDIPKEQKSRIMHMSLPIAGHTVLMGSDTGGEWAKDFQQGNNFSISVSVDSKQRADAIFAKLSQNGEVITPIKHQFWGDYFGNCRDQFGIGWMVTHDTRQN